MFRHLPAEVASLPGSTGRRNSNGFQGNLPRSRGDHHYWAYRIGQAYRFNDDGEPASSAGKPVLAAIDGQGFNRVVLVVTRWFGGIKLGVGGLIRAYGGTAAQCLQQATQQPIVPRDPHDAPL